MQLGGGTPTTTAAATTVTTATAPPPQSNNNDSAATEAAAAAVGAFEVSEEMHDRGFGGNRWPRQETLALLKIRSDMGIAFRDASVKGPLWEEVSRFAFSSPFPLYSLFLFLVYFFFHSLFFSSLNFLFSNWEWLWNLFFFFKLNECCLKICVNCLRFGSILSFGICLNFAEFVRVVFLVCIVQWDSDSDSSWSGFH